MTDRKNIFPDTNSLPLVQRNLSHGISSRGFTLIELVVVMAIIAVLTALMVAAILAARNASVQAQRTGNVKTVETALEARASKCGVYVSAKGPCATATVSTDFAALASSLKNQGFLSADLPGSLTSGYQMVASMTDSGFTIAACTSGSTTCTDTVNNAYVAKR
jgi:prepilin-type N-terminal cleavage/methylation domain-containing protein